MLLRDEKMADQIRETMSSVQSTTSNLNQASVRVNSIVADVQERQLPQKLDETMGKISSASSRGRCNDQQVRQSLAQALGPDATVLPRAKHQRDA